MKKIKLKSILLFSIFAAIIGCKKDEPKLKRMAPEQRDVNISGSYIHEYTCGNFQKDGSYESWEIKEDIIIIEQYNLCSN